MSRHGKDGRLYTTREINKMLKGGELEGGFWGALLSAAIPMVTGLMKNIASRPPPTHPSQVPRARMRGRGLEGGKTGNKEYRDVYKTFLGNYRPRSLGSVMSTGAGARYPKKGQRTKRGKLAYENYPLKGMMTEEGYPAFATYKRVKKGGYGTSMGAVDNPWVEYVKDYADAHGVDYKDALEMAGPSYRKSHGKSGGMKTGGLKVGGKKGSTNPWIAHVKQYQKEHGISYKEAMKEASSTYIPE